MKTKAGEELVLRTIAQHAESLLRTARRYSLCLDDAHDAYQRALEIFVKNADRLQSGKAAAWLHTVVRNEALQIREQRKELVGTDEVDFDAHESMTIRAPEEHAITYDMLSRSAEALQSLKPQEIRALWLRSQGHSYSDIGAITGWSYTKVNRCLAEGHQSFIKSYSGIESGEECERWATTLVAIVDGEATPKQLNQVRPHLRNCAGCRATLAALQDSTKPIAAVLPVPFIAAAGGGLETIQGFVVRLHDAVAGTLATSSTKVQAAVELSATGKVVAVAASAVAVAGGGYATVERVAPSDERRASRPNAVAGSGHPASEPQSRPRTVVPPASTPMTNVKTGPARAVKSRLPKQTEIERRGGPSPEFERSAKVRKDIQRAVASMPALRSTASPSSGISSPEFVAPKPHQTQPAQSTSPEFAP